jgi:mono/diheme cytochrome c family protein
MPIMPRIRFLLPALSAALVLAGCTLGARPTLPTSDLLTPAVLPTLVADGETAPLQPPDAATGALIFAERCVACHGPQAGGDGPRAEQLRASNAVVPNLVEPAKYRAARPRDWHDVITNGRIQNLMPNFNGSLNAQARWDVQSHVWALGTTSQTLQAGGQLYAQQCASCHGAQGETAFGPASLKLQSPTFLAEKSLLEIAGGMTRGDIHASVQLTDAQRFEVADYVRALNYVYADPATQAVDRISGNGVVSMTVANGTPNGGSPQGLTMVLRTYDQTSEVLSRTATVNDAGVAIFEELPTRQDYFFQAELDYEQGRFYGPPMQFISPTTTISDALRIYETTTDTAGITISEMHFFVQDISEGTATIVEFYIFDNGTDRAYIGEEATGSRRHTLRLSVPQDAQNLRFDGLGLGRRFFQEGDVIFDTDVVVPGPQAQQITMLYEVPYRGQQSFSREVFYPVVRWDVLVPVNASAGDPLTVSGLEDRGVQETPSGNLNLYVGQPATANTALTWTLNGQPRGAAVPGADPRAIGIGLIAFGLSIGIAYFLFMRVRAIRAQQLSPAKQRDLLLRQLALLDDEFAQGKVKEADYRATRERLKEELREEWDA